MTHNSRPASILSFLWILIILSLPAQGQSQPPPHAFIFSPITFITDRPSVWKPLGSKGLWMNDNYIAAPTPGQDRNAWLKALHDYRRCMRDKSCGRMIELNNYGNRTWVRLAGEICIDLNLKPGEKLRVSIEARHIKGHHDICVAFDVNHRKSNYAVRWGPVSSVMSLEKNKQWQRLEAEIEVPLFDYETQWAMPRFGMDKNHDATPSTMEIRNIQLHIDDSQRMQDAITKMIAINKIYDDYGYSIYDRKDLTWAASTFACHFTFMFDRSFYNPQTGRYTLNEFLEDGKKEFGGYDAILLWQGYPRLGLDDRNQFDMYRDMPGGLEGIRDLVRQAHKKGVKIFIDYNPWDRGTRREDKTDDELLADLVAAIEADGIFLDTMAGGSSRLREMVDEARPGVVLAPEGYPQVYQLGLLSMSWAQWLNEPIPPGLLVYKWIEPRHIQHQIRRWNREHQKEIATAFFNGSGMMIWENIFGTYNPWPRQDRLNWNRAVSILRYFKTIFTSERMDPFYPTLVDKLSANRWPGDDATVFTLYNTGEPIDKKKLLEVPANNQMVYYNLWNGQPIETKTVDNKVRMIGSVNGLGCILAIDKNRIDKSLDDLLAHQRNITDLSTYTLDPRNKAQSVIKPLPITRTELAQRNNSPKGMVFVPAASIHMKLKHQRRECGCYPDPAIPQKKWKDFLWGNPQNGILHHNIGPVEVKSFFIDETEVTNAEFKRFLDVTGYRPKHSENFLKHWPDGKIPPELADHPVVYVDLDEARAYAKWAGKRLPTEAEWHLAAQGTDGRQWPWGNQFDPNRCNTTEDKTLPARSLAAGRSPYGCYHMSGNVWEWTESYRDDGHTRFAIIRGGSYYKAAGSGWYINGGPQPCNHHAKMILMWPGMDRCATLGFRCVVDAAE